MEPLLFSIARYLDRLSKSATIDRLSQPRRSGAAFGQSTRQCRRGDGAIRLLRQVPPLIRQGPRIGEGSTPISGPRFQEMRPPCPKRTSLGRRKRRYLPTMSSWVEETTAKISLCSLSGTLYLSRTCFRRPAVCFHWSSVIIRPLCESAIVRPL